MQTQLEGYDWEQAFCFASGVAKDGYCSTPEVACPGLTTPTTPFDIDDVTEVVGSVEGENDVAEWVCYGRLNDGRFFALTAGCDHTGWDYQAGGSSAVADTLDQIVRFGLTEESRYRLGITI